MANLNVQHTSPLRNLSSPGVYCIEDLLDEPRPDWIAASIEEWEETEQRERYSNGYVFDTVEKTGGLWPTLGEVKEMRRYAGEFPGLEAKAQAMLRCGEKISVRVCDCGHEHEGTGSFGEFVRRCKARTCPSCAWVRAQKMYEFVSQLAAEGLIEVDGYEWRYLVLTTKYDPRDPEDVTWQALRHRLGKCQKMAKAAWAEVLKAPGAGMLRTIEVGVHGHVHVNILYYGPEFDPLDVEEAAKEGWKGAGAVFCQRVEDQGQEGGLLEAIGKVARYIHKSLDSSFYAFDEDYLGGERGVRGIDPRLAGRWELAAWGSHLTQRYGVFRGVKFDENAKHEPPERPDDSGVVCPECGQIGQWRTELRNTTGYIQRCHHRGKPAFMRSHWVPPWMRPRRPDT